MGEGGSALDSHENWCEISRRSEIYKNPRESCCKIDILQKFDYRYKKYHGQIWISKKPIHFGHICWVFILFLVNTWTSMVPWFLLTTEASNSSPGSAHFSPMASQALCHGTSGWTVAISERNGSAQVGFYFSHGIRLPKKTHGFFVEKHRIHKKVWEDFLRSFIFLGGVEMFDVTLLRFFGWHDTYSWVLEVWFGGVNTHWKHRWYQNALHMNPPSLGATEANDLLLEKLAKTQIKRRSTPIQSTQWPAGGVWDLNISIHFPSFAQDGAPQPSCNPLFFLTLVMGGITFHPQKPS